MRRNDSEDWENSNSPHADPDLSGSACGEKSIAGIFLTSHSARISADFYPLNPQNQQAAATFAASFLPNSLGSPQLSNCAPVIRSCTCLSASISPFDLL